MRAKTCDTTLVVNPSEAISVCVLPVILDIIPEKILQSQGGLIEVKSYLSAFKIKRRLLIYNVKDHSSKASLKKILRFKNKEKILSPLFISYFFFEQLTH